MRVAPAHRILHTSFTMQLSIANHACSAVPPHCRARVPDRISSPTRQRDVYFSRSSYGSSFLQHGRLTLQNSRHARHRVALGLDDKDFPGIEDAEDPVDLCQTRTLEPVLSLADAQAALISAIDTAHASLAPTSTGILRLQVSFSEEVKALQWLQWQPHNEQLWPHIYFSPRLQSGSHGQDVIGFEHVAGVGSAVFIKGQKSLTSGDLKRLKRFLSKDCPLIRAYGAIRFDEDTESSEEWKDFGSFLFSIPQVELCEGSGYPILAVTVAWDEASDRDFNSALSTAKGVLFQIAIVAGKSVNPMLTILSKEHIPSEQAWHALMKDVLEVLDDNDNPDVAAQPQGSHMKHAFCDVVGLSKVVLARRTKIVLDTTVESLTLLSILQAKNPSSCQFCIQLSNSSFIGSTPERLFYKEGAKVFSEAVAGTRARGVTEIEDYELGIELLSSIKDHVEFDIVVESIKQRLTGICKSVKVESYKDLIKQANVQHLYGCLAGELCDGISEFEILSELHPTPAVCGQPQNLAKSFLSKIEKFDRGMFSGPIGWMSGERAEFLVAIRSALVADLPNLSIHKADKVTQLLLFAGVGIVKSSKSFSEWKELDLKIQQFESICQPFSSLHEAVNIKTLWSRLIIEECCKLGIIYFCIAPGSISSPLAIAAAENDNAKCVSCVDERSLAFHALGYDRQASTPAAIITTSRLEISNILHMVAETREDCIPLVFFTSDSPPELLHAGSDGCIEQVNEWFKSFVRHQISLPTPSGETQAKVILRSLDAALLRATSSPKGPVHINIPF